MITSSEDCLDLPRLHVGTYARNGGAGLHQLVHIPGRGWSIGRGNSDAQNASFGTYAPRYQLYYFVDEDEGCLGAFRLEETALVRQARVTTQGSAPCYVALNAEQSCLVVANYGSGSIALFRLDAATGLPLTSPDVRQNFGSGPVEERQDGPHAHCACFSPDQRWLYHVDLGADEILAYSLDRTRCAVGARQIAFKAPAGSGPRHLVFHPRLPLALLVSELASTLTVLEVREGRLSTKQTVSTLPPGFVDKNFGGHLSINAAGDRVYVTNRGHDSIAVFDWSARGVLKLLRHVPSGGASPRAFVLLESRQQLLIANEEDGSVVAYSLDSDGCLSLNGRLSIPGAAFLLVGHG